MFFAITDSQSETNPIQGRSCDFTGLLPDLFPVDSEVK